MKYLKLVTIFYIALSMAACTSMKSVKVEKANSYAELVQHIKVGDELEITTNKGGIYQLVVKSISKDAITGSDSQVAIENIKMISKKEPSFMKTMGAVGVGLGILTVLTFGYIYIIF